MDAVMQSDCVLKNIFAYLVKDSHAFIAPHMNKKEEKLFNQIKLIILIFKDFENNSIKIMCVGLCAHENNICFILSKVCDELFSKGIDWNYVVSFFVFVGELTKKCIFSKYSNLYIIYNWFSDYFTQYIEIWFRDHGGWNGMISHYLPYKKSSKMHVFGVVLMITIVCIKFLFLKK